MRNRSTRQLLRRPAVVVAVSCLALTAAACGGGGDGAGSEDELVIGTIMPLTGPQEALSNSYQSMQAYFDQVNADGGIDGVKIRLEVQDDQFNAVNTPAAARALVEQEGAQMLCANQGSGTFKAIAPYLAARKIGAIPMSGESSLFTSDTTGFQLLTPYELTGAALVRHAVDEMDLSKIAIAYTEDGIGLPFRSGAREELEKRGLEPAAEIQLNASAADQTPAAAKLRESGAEIVLFNHVAPVVSQLVRASDRLGFRPQWGLSYPALNKQVLELSGEALDDRAVFTTPFPDYQADSLADYRTVMEREHPDVDVTDFLTVEGWVVGSVCTDVIRRAVQEAGGVPTAEQLLDALAATTIDDDFVQGLEWTEKSRVGQRDLQIMALRDGEFVNAAPYAPAPDVELGQD